MCTVCALHIHVPVLVEQGPLISMHASPSHSAHHLTSNEVDTHKAARIHMSFEEHEEECQLA